MRNIRTQRFGNTERKTFSRIKEVLDLPNLIEVQKIPTTLLCARASERYSTTSLP